MRVLLVTGAGGVGKTTVAAATAAHAARRGLKTLVLSTDAAPSLAEVLGVSLAGGEPVEVETGLYAQHAETRTRLEQVWGGIQDRLLAVLDAEGIAPVQAPELTVLPGFEEVLALLEVRDQVRSGRWDLVVVDCGESLRLLTVPDSLSWWLQRLFPMELRVARALQPVGDDSFAASFEAVDRLTAELADVRDVLGDPGTSVRIVATPESVAAAAAKRLLTALTVFGHRVDGVVANRIVPAGPGGDAWRDARVARERAVLADLDEAFAPLPVRRTAYALAEPVGVDALTALADEAYGETDVLQLEPADPLLEVERVGEEYELSLAVPLAARDDMELARRGHDLLLTVGASRRVVTLPSALRRCTVAGAALRDGRLRIRFLPDPALWRSP
jgi:arsenite-transporting ATPase